MKKGYSLLELIFVIVIMGIMMKVGFSSFTPKYLIDDVNFVQAKIKEAQFLGIGYEHNDFGTQSSDADFTTGCIKMTKSALEENATIKNSTNYQLHVTITADNVSEVICFDSKGRPHEDDFTTKTLYDSKKTFIFKYNSKERNITIEPITGYVIIKS